MRHLVLFLIGSTWVISSFAQKPALDTSVLYNWPIVEGGQLTSDGHFVGYTVQNQPVKSRTLILQDTHGGWRKEVEQASHLVFTRDSRQAIFFNSMHSLVIESLGTDTGISIPAVNSFELFSEGSMEYLLFRLDTLEKKLILRNMQEGGDQTYVGVLDYIFDASGKALILKVSKIENGDPIQQIVWVDLSHFQENVIWKGVKADNLILDKNGIQLVFKAKASATDSTESIWCYKEGQKGALVLANTRSYGVEPGMSIGKILNFDKHGDQLFFNLTQPPTMKKEVGGSVQVEVSSYLDSRLQSEQVGDNKDGNDYLAVIDLNKSNRLIRLQWPNERLPIGFVPKGAFAVFDSTEGSPSEWNWSRASKPFFKVVSTSTGGCRTIGKVFADISPNEKFILAKDQAKYHYYVYELATSTLRDISSKIPRIARMSDEFDYPHPENNDWVSIAGWLDQDSAIIVYDRYDIWQVDPRNEQPPINLTNGYGRENKIVFRLAEENEKIFPDKREIIVISAFDKKNKNSGFFRLFLHRHKDPEPLSMGPFNYAPSSSIGRSDQVIRALDTTTYLVRRESVAESPNYFTTTDFRKFTKVSNNYPEKRYNWINSTLISFMIGKNQKGSAALYRPDNFRPDKKYPVIVHFYERKTDDLNHYKLPEGPSGELNIAWFVSHGYVVVTPDISFQVGQPGKSALNIIVAVTRFLQHFIWVDPKRIGIQGHSFGGYEANYIVTHSNLFAAAVASSGPCDLISLIGEPWPSGKSKLGLLEYDQQRIGATLWQQPGWYINNSPIFRVDKITTPLLMVGNKRDQNVYFTQSLAFFTALRRLGKPAWMLSYDNGRHGLWGRERTDYLLRMTQFFDHYLKGVYAPKWMTEGIPASRKGWDRGFELDSTLKNPGIGLREGRN